MSKKNYLEMFYLPCLQADAWRSDIRANIDFAKEVLKKNDKIVWYLRYYKASLLHNLEALNPGVLGRKEKNWLTRNAEATSSLSEVDGKPKFLIKAVKSTLEHFVRDSGLTEIENYEFGKQSFIKIRDDLEKIEYEAQYKDSDRSVEAYGEVIMRMPDGMTWFDLQRSGCEIEGKAMHHCGNGTGFDEQNLYSLRSPDPDRKGRWIPRVTLVMNDVDRCATGEIKGYANNKPSAEYHAALVEFLKLPIVEEMHGGGYRPENNFSINDLNEELSRTLFASKPSLFSLIDRYIMNQRQIVPDMIDALGIEFRDAQFDSKSLGNTKINVMEGYDIKSFARNLKLMRVFETATSIDSTVPFHAGSSDVLLDRAGDAVALLDFMNRAQPHLMAAVRSQLASTMDKDVLENRDLEDRHDLYDVITQADGDFAHALRQAVTEGQQSGLRQEFHYECHQLASSLNEMIGHGLVINADKSWENWRLEISLKDAFELLIDKQFDILENDFNIHQDYLADCLGHYVAECVSPKLQQFDMPCGEYSDYNAGLAEQRVVTLFQEAVQKAPEMSMSDQSGTKTEDGLRCKQPFDAVVSPLATEAFQRKHQANKGLAL